jgi:hypothetical protein
MSSDRPVARSRLLSTCGSPAKSAVARSAVACRPKHHAGLRAVAPPLLRGMIAIDLRMFESETCTKGSFALGAR